MSLSDYSSAYIGIFLFSDRYTGKKIASRVIKNIPNFFIGSDLCSKIIAGIYIDSIASIKAFKNAGYKEFKRDSENYSLNGEKTTVLFLEYT